MSAEKIGTETKSLEDRMNNLLFKPVLEKSLLDDILEEKLKKMGHDLRELGKDRRILIEEGDYLFKSETFLNYYGRVSIIEGIISGRRVKLVKGERESTASGLLVETVIMVLDGGDDEGWTTSEGEEDDDLYNLMSRASRREKEETNCFALELDRRHRQLNWAHDDPEDRKDKIETLCYELAQAKHYEESSKLYEAFSKAAIPIYSES